MLSQEYILKLMKDYAKSDAGKKNIKKTTGLTYLENVDIKNYLVTNANLMKSILYEHIPINSVSINDIIVGEPRVNKDGRWEISVSFDKKNLKRDSLDLYNYPEGIENIVLLFTTGYSARDYVYGWWVSNGTTKGNVRSKIERRGDDFLSRAVKEFNNKTDKNLAQAKLTEEYKKAIEEKI